VSGEANEIVAADVAHLTRAMSGILRRLDPCGRGLHLTVARAERGGCSSASRARSAWKPAKSPLWDLTKARVSSATSSRYARSAALGDELDEESDECELLRTDL